MDVGPAELLIVLIIALVLFGGAKLPQLAKGLGQAKHEFEKGIRGEGDDAAPVAEAPKTVVVVPQPAVEATTSASVAPPVDPVQDRPTTTA